MKKKKINPNVRAITIPFKINAEEMRWLLKQSHAYCRGNVSKFVRCAVKNYKPKREDFNA